MADNNDRGGVSAATLYSALAQAYVAMAMVLLVAVRPERDWVTVAVLVVLVLLLFLYGGAAVWLRLRKKTPEGPPA